MDNDTYYLAQEKLKENQRSENMSKMKWGQTKADNKDKHLCRLSQMEIADEGQMFSK